MQASRGAHRAPRHTVYTFPATRRLNAISRYAVPALATALILSLAACATVGTAPATVRLQAAPSAAQSAFLDTVERRTFMYFWETANPRNGLVPDRWPTPSFSSVAAVGFALTAYPVGVEHGWITRKQAQQRVLATLRFFWTAPQGPAESGVTGYHGFFYHFLDMRTGYRFQHVELSTIDSGILLAGAQVCRQYFDDASAGDSTIRALADSLYLRADWNWARDGDSTLSMGWRPDSAAYQNARGFITTHWQGYDEGMVLYILALGSPTHPIGASAWSGWTSTYRWDEFEGEQFVQFPPLFGHQYSHIWIDFRGIADEYMRRHASDYFENSRRAVLSQQRYAVANPNGWRGYGATTWGLSASDGPLDSTLLVDGRERTFRTYAARGVSSTEQRDDGTITPTAAGGSIPFAPQLAIAALQGMRTQYGDSLFSRYGFVDAFNPTLDEPGVPVTQGYIVPGVAWFDRDYLGIDQGPIVAMIENYRTALVWRLMRGNPYFVRGLCRAGFRGGWLASHC
jgi:hypothetical protein